MKTCPSGTPSCFSFHVSVFRKTFRFADHYSTLVLHVPPQICARIHRSPRTAPTAHRGHSERHPHHHRHEQERFAHRHTRRDQRAGQRERRRGSAVSGNQDKEDFDRHGRRERSHLHAAQRQTSRAHPRL